MSTNSRIYKVISASALVIMLVGCTPQQAPQAAPTVTVTAPAPTVTVTVTETAAPEPAKESESPNDLKVGETWENGIVSVTVEKIERVTKTSVDDEILGGVLIKTCIVGLPDGSEALSLNWDPWYLVGPDSEQYSPTSYRDIKMPDYPDDPEQGFEIGECAKGWIVFESGGKKVEAASYRPDSGERATWTIK